MKLELKKPAYKNMKLVKIYYGNDNPAQSRQATVAMLQAYPNLKGIESPTTVGISSAAQYLSTSKYKKKVVLTGLGLPSQMKKYVHNGTVTAFALWNPEDLGYLAGYAVSALADGQDHGQGRRDVQGRQARHVQDHQGPGRQAAGDPRAAVHVHGQERRQVQVLGSKTARGAAACRGAPPHPTPLTHRAPRTTALPRARREELRRRPRARGRRHRALRRRGTRPRRRERRRQVDARQDPRRRPPAGRRPALARRRRGDLRQREAVAGRRDRDHLPGADALPRPERRREHLRRGAAAEALPPHRRQADAPRGGRRLRAARRAARPRPARARALDRRPAARRDREGADDERARDRDGRADRRAGQHRGRAAVRHRRDAARARQRGAVRLAPSGGDLRDLPARHGDARRPPRPDQADRGADDPVGDPRDGRPRHGRPVPEGSRPSRAGSS